MLLTPSVAQGGGRVRRSEGRNAAGRSGAAHALGEQDDLLRLASRSVQVAAEELRKCEPRRRPPAGGSAVDLGDLPPR